MCVALVRFPPLYNIGDAGAKAKRVRATRAKRKARQAGPSPPLASSTHGGTLRRNGTLCSVSSEPPRLRRLCPAAQEPRGLARAPVVGKREDGKKEREKIEAAGWKREGDRRRTGRTGVC